MGGKVKGLPIWAQISLPIATAILGGVIVWLLNIPTTTFQKRIQKASNDYQRATLIMEIIDKSDSNYYPSLDTLIATIEDSELKKAMTRIIQSRKNLPAQIKTEIEEKNQEAIKEQTVSEVSATTAQKEEPKPFDSTCVIVYLKGDLVGKRSADSIQYFLANKRVVSRYRSHPFKYYRIKDQDTSWFNDYFPLAENTTEINMQVRVFYWLPRDSAFSWKLHYYLKEGRFGTKYKEERDGCIYYDGIGGNRFLGDSILSDICEPAKDSCVMTLDYGCAIVIPPSSYTEEVRDSLYWLRNQ